MSDRCFQEDYSSLDTPRPLPAALRNQIARFVWLPGWRQVEVQSLTLLLTTVDGEVGPSRSVELTGWEFVFLRGQMELETQVIRVVDEARPWAERILNEAWGGRRRLGEADAILGEPTTVIATSDALLRLTLGNPQASDDWLLEFLPDDEQARPSEQ